MTITDLELEFSPANSSIPFSSDDGCLIANGKIGLVTQLTNAIDVTRVFITKNVAHNHGLYQPNVIDVFHPFRIMFFSFNTEATTCSNVTNKLFMETACYKGVYHVQNQDGSDYSVSSKLYALRHLPYTFLQTIEVTPNSVNTTNSCNLFHEVYTKDNIRDVNYDHTFTSLSMAQGSQTLYQFYGSGKSDSDVETVAFSSCYMWEGQVNLKHNGSARPIVSSRPNSAYYHFECSNMVVGSPFKIHILTTIMTSHDFQNPLNESRAINLSICGARGCIPSLTIDWILGKHVTAWSNLWKTRIRITPRPDASTNELTSVMTMNKLLNVALYNMYAVVRENFNTELGDGIPVIDIDGSFLYDGDLWFVPTLLVLKPMIAKSMIEYRFKQLQTARQVAAAYGYDGAKFPYVEDVLGYKNSLYIYDASVMFLHNTALAAIHAWNYYRASRDKEWLRNKGFVILQQVAIFLVDIVKKDSEAYTYYYQDIMGPAGRVSSRDNAFNSNLIKLALRYAVEAAYELQSSVPSTWNDVYDGLRIIKNNTYVPPGIVTKVDADFSDSDHIAIIEPMYNFLPTFWEEEYGLTGDRRALMCNTIKTNIEFYQSRISEGNEHRPSNIALKTVAAGIYSSISPLSIVSFINDLQEFIDQNVYGPWYFMKHDDPTWLPVNEQGIRQAISKNSIYTNAMFISIFLQGLAQARWSGGVSDTRFYYADLKLLSIPTTTLPVSWRLVNFINMGDGIVNTKNIDIRQSAIIDNSNYPDGYPRDFTIYTP